MTDKEFFDQFDEFSGDVIVKLREALAITVKNLKCFNTELALSQIEHLRTHADYRLKNLDRPMDVLFKPEEHVDKVQAAVLAVINHALDDAKEFTLDCEKSIYGPAEDEDDEFDEAADAQDEAEASVTGEESGAGGAPEPEGERLKIRARRPRGGGWMGN